MSTTETQHTETSEPSVPADRPLPETVTWSVDATPWPTSSVRKTALFRETLDGWILQHIRTITVGQRAPSRCEIDTEPALEELPRFVRASLPDDVREVSARA